MRFLALQSKDVIDASTGIVERFSAFKFICFFKGPPAIVIPIEHIITIGEDVILVHVECS